MTIERMLSNLTLLILILVYIMVNLLCNAVFALLKYVFILVISVLTQR